MNNYHLRKTGLKLFPGTLNVQLEETYALPANVIRLEREEIGGAVSVNILPCRVFGLEAVILRTDNAEFGEGFHPISRPTASGLTFLGFFCLFTDS